MRLMRQLWAPWRMEYIRKAAEATCIFCEKPKEQRDKDNLILYRGETCFIIMNKFPYNNGHLMVAPYRHLVNMEELSQEEMGELFKLVKKSVMILKKTLKPEGFNIGMNVGRVAGAGFNHFHVHVVPRWFGDTSFMPILAESKVVSQHLSETFDQLVREFKPQA